MSRVRSLLRRRPVAELPPGLNDVGVAAQPSGDLATSKAGAEWPTPALELVGPAVLTDPVTPVDSLEDVTPPLAPQDGVHVGGGDLVALSHAFAAAGRLHEAALAQWAADLQLVRPHLGTRAAELCATLESLSPLDPQSALAGARTALASLVDEDVPVLSLLGPTWHLSRRGGPQAGPRPIDDESSALPTHLEVALDTALELAAQQAGDSRRVSVALRRSLLRHRSARHGADDPTRLVRGVLEPYERPAFDDELQRLTS